MTIDHWRKEIDDIDAELLRLLNMRARLALKVGALKQAADLPFCDPERNAPFSNDYRRSTMARSTNVPSAKSSAASFANRGASNRRRWG